MKGLLTGLGSTSILVWAIAAWLTHIVVCFAASSWGFLIAGAILVPVALGHGTWVWFQ